MSVFKDFPGLDNLEKNSRTFKDLQEPLGCCILHWTSFIPVDHQSSSSSSSYIHKLLVTMNSKCTSAVA